MSISKNIIVRINAIVSPIIYHSVQWIDRRFLYIIFVYIVYILYIYYIYKNMHWHRYPRSKDVSYAHIIPLIN